jgi:hypothetical protein
MYLTGGELIKTTLTIYQGNQLAPQNIGCYDNGCKPVKARYPIYIGQMLNCKTFKCVNGLLDRHYPITTQRDREYSGLLTFQPTGS